MPSLALFPFPGGEFLGGLLQAIGMSGNRLRDIF